MSELTSGREYALTREQEVWLRAWCASAIDGSQVDIATEWADECLKAFRERWPESKPKYGPFPDINPSELRKPSST